MRTKTSAASQKEKFLNVQDDSGFPGTWSIKITISATPRQKSSRKSRSRVEFMPWPQNGEKPVIFSSAQTWFQDCTKVVRCTPYLIENYGERSAAMSMPMKECSTL